VHGDDVQGIGPARLLNAAAVGLAWVTVSKSSTLKVTVFDVELLFGSTLVAVNCVVVGGQYHELLSLQIFGRLLICGKKYPFEPLSIKLAVRDWPPAGLVMKLSD